MPSGNTNIMKKYKEKYEEIDSFHEYNFIKNFDKYINECNDISKLEDYHYQLQDEVVLIRTFINDLRIVLKADKLKNEDSYTKALENAETFKAEYENQLQRIIEIKRSSEAGV